MKTFCVVSCLAVAVMLSHARHIPSDMRRYVGTGLFLGSMNGLPSDSEIETTTPDVNDVTLDTSTDVAPTIVLATAGTISSFDGTESSRVSSTKTKIEPVVKNNFKATGISTESNVADNEITEGISAGLDGRTKEEAVEGGNFEATTSSSTDGGQTGSEGKIAATRLEGKTVTTESVSGDMVNGKTTEDSSNVLEGTTIAAAIVKIEYKTTTSSSLGGDETESFAMADGEIGGEISTADGVQDATSSSTVTTETAPDLNGEITGDASSGLRRTTMAAPVVEATTMSSLAGEETGSFAMANGEIGGEMSTDGKTTATMVQDGLETTSSSVAGDETGSFAMADSEIGVEISTDNTVTATMVQNGLETTSSSVAGDETAMADSEIGVEISTDKTVTASMVQDGLETTSSFVAGEETESFAMADSEIGVQISTDKTVTASMVQDGLETTSSSLAGDETGSFAMADGEIGVEISTDKTVTATMVQNGLETTSSSLAGDKTGSFAMADGEIGGEISTAGTTTATMVQNRLETTSSITTDTGTDIMVNGGIKEDASSGISGTAKAVAEIKAEYKATTISPIVGDAIVSVTEIIVGGDNGKLSSDGNFGSKVSSVGSEAPSVGKVFASESAIGGAGKHSSDGKLDSKVSSIDSVETNADEEFISETSALNVYKLEPMNKATVEATKGKEAVLIYELDSVKLKRQAVAV